MLQGTASHQNRSCEPAARVFTLVDLQILSEMKAEQDAEQKDLSKIEVTAEEIKQTLFSLNGNQAPAPL